MTTGSSHLVAVCYSNGADVSIWSVRLDGDQRACLHGALLALVEFGQVAAFALIESGASDWDELVCDLGKRVGVHTIDACLAAPLSGSPPPAFVMPVWPFDHEIGGALASTAQFLGLDLELIATASPDEELGAFLPDRNGRWLIHARPLSS